MTDLNLQITLNPASQNQFAPGSIIRGTVSVTSSGGSWEADSIELILFWQTSGIGSTDEGIVTTLELVKKDTTVSSFFNRDFEITAPLHPWTYYGKLIKIHWYLGLYVKKGWLSTKDVKIPLEIRPAISLDPNPPNEADNEAIFYDEHGIPTTPPSTI